MPLSVKPILLSAISLLLFGEMGRSQSFDWQEDGYVNGSGGGTYLNIDGSGIDLRISGLVNDRTFRQTGTIKTGIDNYAAGKVIHRYQFIFSEKVDLKFSVYDINGGPGACGFIDHVGFSGNPIFSAARAVEIVDDSLVVPKGNGSITVEYYSIDTLIIYHGAGISCNPGFIGLTSFRINQNVHRIEEDSNTDQDSIGVQNILFATDKSGLIQSHLEQLDELIKNLHDHPNSRIRISGHTDEVGDLSYNMNLSEDRVQSVHEYLLSKDIKNERIEIVFYGETDPDTTNTTEEGRKKNRRVEIQLLE